MPRLHARWSGCYLVVAVVGVAPVIQWFLTADDREGGRGDTAEGEEVEGGRGRERDAKWPEMSLWFSLKKTNLHQRLGGLCLLLFLLLLTGGVMTEATPRGGCCGNKIRQ